MSISGRAAEDIVKVLLSLTVTDEDDLFPWREDMLRFGVDLHFAIGIAQGHDAAVGLATDTASHERPAYQLLADRAAEDGQAFIDHRDFAWFQKIDDAIGDE